MEKPIVYHPGTRRREKRVGRGFSIGELKEAGLTLNDAKRLGIYIDKRRRSTHEENVKILKELIKKVKG